MKSISFSLLVASLAPLLHAQHEGVLDPLVLTTEPGDPLDSLEKSEKRVASLPGGASIIDSGDWTGSVSAIEEIFQFDPGVYARSTATSHDDRLSIRGSGIQRRYGSRGISLLINDMPANQADGDYQFRLIDPLTIRRIEVFRGANGLPFGAAQLGGAINVIQKNGLTDPGTSAIAEYGSHQTYRGSLQHGGAAGKWDWFGAYTYAESDGFRPHSARASHHFTSSLGYQWSDSAVTRFHLLFSDTDELLSGSLTRSQFDSRFNGRVNVGNVDYDLATLRFGQRTAWETAAGGTWEFSSNYQYSDFYHLNTLAGSISPGFPAFDNLVDSTNDEFSLALRGSQDYSALGLDHTFRTSISYVHGFQEANGSSGFDNPGLIGRKETAQNLVLYAENTTALTPRNKLIYGLGYVHSSREREIRGRDTTGLPDFDRSQNGLTWRVGYLYEQDERTQYFANISKSFEAAPFSEAALNSVADPQEAVTFEIGARFSPTPWLNGELTFYRSDVRNEFVYLETAPSSGVFNVTNADTIHQGIEAAAQVNLSEALGVPGEIAYSVDLAYQLNDFTFDEGPADGNQIPAISKHVITFRISATGADEKWRTSLSADWLPEGLVADNNNTLDTPGYVVWDLNCRYRVNESLSLHGGINNLFDRDHATAVLVNPSGPNPAYIFPGDGRTAYIGAKMTF